MQAGDLLLLDEVSLADDSVLERLNSVLEPGRTLVLAEKGGTDIDEATLKANDMFHVVATMNPGGDFGKKELSPALRNRFTEIWVPPLDDRQDLLHIIDSSWKHDELRQCGEKILDFFDWFGQRIGDTAGMGLRDILVSLLTLLDLATCLTFRPGSHSAIRSMAEASVKWPKRSTTEVKWSSWMV
jgi:midasin